MANTYRLNGIASALTAVDEAIKIATARHARFPECLARIVRADILAEAKTGDERAAAMDAEADSSDRRLSRLHGTLTINQSVTTPGLSGRSIQFE